MTEAEWRTCEDPEAMIRVLDSPTYDRKLRLYACGCCRLVWELLADKRSRLALRRLEDFADALNNSKLRTDAYNIANAAFMELRDSGPPEWVAACAVVIAAHPTVPRRRDGNVERALMELKGWDLPIVMRLECELVRDIFGNPFHPVAFSPDWRTDTAVSLARGMYESRDFGAMPILADALQDAGCDSDDILNHCRDANQVHVRGCWVVDIVLDRS